MKLTGRTIFIPGATSGIGLALALRLHGLGNTVIVAGRRRELLDRIRAENPGVETVELDVADADAIRAVSADVLSRFPEVDVLVTMAGIMRAEDLSDPGFLATAEQEVTTNVLGTLRLVAAFTQHLAGRPEGSIVTVSSGLAFTPMAPTATYSATKAFVHSFTDSLRLQLADKVAVYELAPPAVRTDLMPGQADAPWAMPLDAFVDEVIELLGSQGDGEILVENVKPLRNAEADGKRAELMVALASLR